MHRRDDGLMSRRGWLRAARWAAAIFGAAVLIAASIWLLGWWNALSGTKTVFWDWVEQISWLAAILSFPLAVLAGLKARKTTSPQASEGIPERLLMEDRERGIHPSPVAQYAVISFAVSPTSPMAKILSNVTTLTPEQFSARSTETKPPINQMSAHNQLKEELLADRSSVIVVHGQPGTGKTTLVWWVLRETALVKNRRHHDLLPGRRLDAMALLNDIAGTRSGNILGNGEDVLGCLEAAMEAPDGTPVTILIDGAQSLLDPDTHILTDLELDEALGIIAAWWPRRVKVILVFQDVPAPGPGNRWLSRASHIGVSGLPEEHFHTYLKSLDHGDGSLTALAQTEPRLLYDALQGIPRLAELFHTVLALPGNQFNARGLAQKMLEHKDPGERKQQLARLLIDSLGDEQRRVLVALAAYATPVTMEDVTNLLADELAAGYVATLLPGLLAMHVIRETSDRYYLPIPEVHAELTRLPDGPAPLMHQAANILSRQRIEYLRIQRPKDLDVHFAELDIRVRARLWRSSYELVNQMEPILKRWSAAGLLLTFREALVGKLGTSFREMQNDNALGCIYMSRGRLEEARVAFEDALQHESATEWPHGRRKIYINLAALHWHFGRIGDAQQFYRNALAMAEEYDDQLDRMAAMAGLADCFRRWGDYREAVYNAKQALSIAQFESSPWAVGIAVKLARWHSELGQREEANRLIELADRAAEEHPDHGLRVRCMDGRADLLLDAEDLRGAMDTAQRALAEALRLHDPVTVLQARTTLAMAHLKLDDTPAADREIGRAARYRREGGSLIVLALQALTAFRADRDDKAERLFAELEREAVRRRNRDPRDFAAWDFEGLANFGMSVGRDVPLDPAITAFQRVRDRPSGLDARLRFMLWILQARARPGQMDRVWSAISGAAARLDHP
jgi:tetratricopeptide (TPR) repeat protein